MVELSMERMMGFLSLTYVVLKVWLTLHANGVYRTLDECYDHEAKADPHALLLDAIGAQRSLARNAAMLSVVATLLTIMISLYYISIASSRTKSSKYDMRPSRWNIVTKPVAVILMGAAVSTLDALVVGSYGYSHPLGTIDLINSETTQNDGERCVSKGRVETIITLAAITLVLYAVILLVGHYMGLRRRYMKIKKRRHMSETGHHSHHHGESCSSSDSDDDY